MGLDTSTEQTTVLKQDRVRVLRLVEYEGPRDTVEQQVEKSLHGTRLGIHRKGSDPVRITAVTLGIYPEVIEEARAVSAPTALTEAMDALKWTQRELQAARAMLDDYENPGREVSET